MKTTPSSREGSEGREAKRWPLILLALFAAFAPFAPFARTSSAQDARTITEGTTNILAIGIDNRDFDVIRFYLRGSNVIEFRADDVLSTRRQTFVFGPPAPPVLSLDRSNILFTLRSSTNVTAGTAANVISNLLRLQLIDEQQKATNGTR